MAIRYSLKTIMMIIVIVGVTLAWHRSTSTLSAVHERNQVLLEEWVQPLEVSDARIVYHRALKTRDLGVKRWKVYLPFGKRYELQCSISPSMAGLHDVKECVVARIPIAEGISLIEADWRRDGRNAPQVKIAVLGPDLDQASTQMVVFPKAFLDTFARTNGLNETILGYESTAYHSPDSTITFVRSLVTPKPASQLPGENQVVSGGFEVRIQVIDDIGQAPSGGEPTDKSLGAKRSGG